GMRDDNGHGTNVAGIVAGVAPGAAIIPIDVVTGSTTPFERDIAGGLDWVLANRAARNIRAVNLSLGRRRTYATSGGDGGPLGRDPFQWSFMALRQAGTVPVVASGNDAMASGFHDGVAYPACLPGAVSVGATFDASFASARDVDCDQTNVVADTLTCF